MKRLLSLCLLVVFLCVGGLGVAPASAKANAEAKKNAKPKNEDGKKKPALTPEERFNKLNTNGDDKLTKEEATAKAKKPEAKAKIEKMFDKKDKNNDGALTLAEFTAKKAKGDKKPAGEKKKKKQNANQ